MTDTLLRVKVETWISSFRYPGFISGYQPTLPMPPLSTIYGFISAVRGDYTTPNDTSIGYRFESQSKGVDLETVYELSGNLKAKSNVIKREFLFDNTLYLYLDNTDFEEDFKNPHYQIMLGRSTELAYISEVKLIELEKSNNVSLGKTILPKDLPGAHGVFQALPIFFDQEMPRNAKLVRPFILMEDEFQYQDEDGIYYDKDLNFGVWMHDYSNGE